VNARLALGPRVAISGRIPPDDELGRHGWVGSEIENALREIVKEVFASGGNIVHGNHPSFTGVIKEQAEAIGPGSDGHRRVHLFASRYFLTDEIQFRRENEGFAVLTLCGPTNLDRSEAGREPALAEMRRQLFDSCDAAVFIGGRLREESEVIPGVAREFQLAQAHCLPIYFATATGGCARLLFEQEVLPNLAGLRNGLTAQENVDLAAARAIVRDLRELTIARGTLPPPAPDVEHLKMIQAVSARLAGNSFSIKGWSLTLVSALLVLGDKSVSPWNAVLGTIPIIAFAPLDAYYQTLETRFRKLHELVLFEAPLPPALRRIKPFVLEPNLVKDESPSLWKICQRGSIWAYYSTLLLVVAAVFVLAMLGVFQKPAEKSGQPALQSPPGTAKSVKKLLTTSLRSIRRDW
jgi:hypothetical protein